MVTVYRNGDNLAYWCMHGGADGVDAELLVKPHCLALFVDHVLELGVARVLVQDLLGNIV